MRFNQKQARRLLAVPVLLVLVVSVVGSGVATAQPRIFVTSADVQQDTALVGEETDVKVVLRNTGSTGAITVDVTANGSVVGSERVQVESGEYETVRVPISIDQRGVYKIRAENTNAGKLNVTRVRTSTVSEREDGRTVLAQAAAVDEGRTLRATTSPVDGFAVREVAMTAEGQAYNRSITTYAPPDGAPFDVPDDDTAAVIGAVEMDEVDGVATTSITVSVPRESMEAAGVTEDEIGIYRVDDGAYRALETTETDTGEDGVVYRAETDDGARFAVGSLEPSFAVQNRSLSTASVDDGKEITVTAQLANEGHVDGEHTLRMRVDGERVASETVTVGAGETTEVRLTHTVAEQGEYDVTLNGQSVGSVVFAGDVSSSGGDGGPASTEAGESATEESPSDAIALPNLGDIGLLELGVGAAVVLLGGALLLLVRR